MSELRDWLERKQADLIGSIETAVAGTERAKDLSQLQVSTLVLATAAAVEQGPEVIETLLRQWQEEAAGDGAHDRWVASLTAVRETLWTHIVSEFSPATALHHLRTLDRLFSELISVAVELDIDGSDRKQERLLQEVRGQLWRLERSKSDFIKIAAHELKTPLTLIDGYANMLMTEIPEEVRSKTDILLGGIANGTRRLGEIIEGMIDVSMIDTQVLDVTFQPLFMRQLVRTVAEDLATVLRIRQIEFTVDPFPPDGAPTYGDSERLYQAIYNVVGNSIKYTPDNGSIRIRNIIAGRDARFGTGAEQCLELQISDTGIGIAPEDLERIFDKFVGSGSVALHSTGKYKFKGGGPGLGLAISKGILEAHGGRIWAESTGYDEARCPGSTFHLLIPLYRQPPTKVDRREALAQ